MTKMQSTIKVNCYSNKFVEKILEIEKKCFPQDWLYPDAHDYYTRALKNKNCINIFLKENRRFIGYILGVPLNDIIEILAKNDAKIEKDEKRMYLETIQILKDYRGKGGAAMLIDKMCREANRKGFTKFAVHARKLNGFNKKIKKMFRGNITHTRKIDRWKFGGNEPYEYIEWNINNKVKDKK